MQGVDVSVSGPGWHHFAVKVNDDDRPSKKRSSFTLLTNGFPNTTKEDGHGTP